MSTLHDRAFIVSTGDEVTTGQLLDTNSQLLADRLMTLGILPIEHATVPDELDVLVETLRRACDRAPLVVMSGGLGPTEGDLTRQAIAKLTGDELVCDDEARTAIERMLTSRGRPMTDRQARQAQRPSRSTCLPNLVGTAPGLWAKVKVAGAWGETDVFCLPGPPGELRPMFETQVVPNLRRDQQLAIETRQAHIIGVAEAECVNRLGDLTKRDANPLVGITASGGILTLRVRAEGHVAEAAKLADSALMHARHELGDHLFGVGAGRGWTHLVAAVHHALKQQQATLATVESCTGGLLGSMLTSVSGASATYAGGFVTYANAMKIGLGVDPAALELHGAVSVDIAREMALAGILRSQAHHCLAITGIAGPDGGTNDKPVGTVYIAHVSVGGGDRTAVDTRLFRFSGDREDIRQRACVSALAMLYFALNGRAIGEPKLLWQMSPD